MPDLAEPIISFTVVGIPMPEGSKNFWKGRVIDSSGVRLEGWRDQVIAAARPFVFGLDHPLFEKSPLWCDIRFRLPKGPSLPKKRIWPYVKPDCDKLVRGVLDALQMARVVANDALVCRIIAEKTYALGTEMTGADIKIGML